MCAQMNFPGLDGSTSSPGSGDGQRPSESPGGQQTSPSGPAAPHASLSASPGKDSAKMIPDTSPPTLRGWSGLGAPWCCSANRSLAQRFSARFQDRLAERLQGRLHGHGAMIYKTVWKVRVTPMGRQICALRASALRTLDSVSFSALFAGMPSGSSVSGWPTTTVTDGLKQGAVSPRPGMMGLSETAPLAGWSTASARDWKDSAGMATEGVNPDGSTRSRTDQLPRQAQLAGWPTPSASDDRRGGRDHRGDDRLVSGPDGSGGGMADMRGIGRIRGRAGQEGGEPGTVERSDGLRPSGRQSRTRPLHNFWADADWLFCRDERWRPVEPIDERMAYGVSIALDARLFEVVDAQTRQILAAETLRAMRNGHGPQAIWGSVGGCCGFPAASVLLAILCEHTGALGHFQHFWPTSGEKDRIARHLQQVWLRFGALAGPPSGRGFSEQLARQLGNALPKLSRKSAPHWQALALLTSGPLAKDISGRVGLLRGYGNAINPWLAAAFIEAFARSIIDIGGGNA